MGEHCCGNKPKSSLLSHRNCITNELAERMERNNLRWEKIRNNLAKFKDDGVWFYEELDALNRVGNKVIADNFSLRADIEGLNSKISVLELQVKKFKEAESLQDLENAKNFPFDERFRPAV